jgi:hypothetical protein
MGLRVAYAVQGNKKPLATKSNWAMTIDDHEGAKAPTVKLIVPVTIPHHRNKVPYCLRWSLCLCDQHCNKCVGDRFFCCHHEKQCWQGCTTRQPRLFIAEVITKHHICTSPSRMFRLCQWSPPLLAGAQVPRDKRLVSEGVELLITINFIDDRAMGNSDLCTLKVPDSQIVRRLSGARFLPLHILCKPWHNNSWWGAQQKLKPSWCWPALW